MAQWYISRNGQLQEGPLTEPQLKTMIIEGSLRPEHLAWRQGLAEWAPVASFAELRPQPVQPPRLDPPQRPVDPLISHSFAPPARPWAPASLRPEPTDANRSEGSAPHWMPPPHQGPPADIIASAYQLQRFAGFGFRLMALLVDSVAVGVVYSIVRYVILVFAAIVIRSLESGPGGVDDDVLQALALIFGFVASVASLLISWLYYAGLECSSRQATLGKLAFGLAVVDSNGQRLGFGRASGRYFGKLLSGLLLAAGFLMAAFTPKRQGLHDLMAGTLVLRVR
jgi:uncharacterized RDD family membrane protein YckC